MNSQSDARTLSLSFELPHAPTKVWRALTQPELVKQWLMPTDIDAREGQQFTFRTKPMPWWDGVVNCEVLEVEEHKKLKYTWRGGGVDTTVTWTLTATDTGTRLDLEQSGQFPDTVPAFEGARQGWQMMVGKRLIEVLTS
jgi:uncharacterized protein YndB with AHSA1/START domain